MRWFYVVKPAMERLLSKSQGGLVAQCFVSAVKKYMDVTECELVRAKPVQFEACWASIDDLETEMSGKFDWGART